MQELESLRAENDALRARNAQLEAKLAHALQDAEAARRRETAAVARANRLSASPAAPALPSGAKVSQRKRRRQDEMPASSTSAGTDLSLSPSYLASVSELMSPTVPTEAQDSPFGTHWTEVPSSSSNHDESPLDSWAAYPFSIGLSQPDLDASDKNPQPSGSRPASCDVDVDNMLDSLSFNDSTGFGLGSLEAAPAPCPDWSALDCEDEFKSWTTNLLPSTPPAERMHLEPSSAVPSCATDADNDVPSQDVRKQVLAMSAEEQQRFLAKLVQNMIGCHFSAPATEPATAPAVCVPASPPAAHASAHCALRAAEHSPSGVVEASLASPCTPPPRLLPVTELPTQQQAALESQFPPAVLLAYLLPLRLVQVALGKLLLGSVDGTAASGGMDTSRLLPMLAVH